MKPIKNLIVAGALIAIGNVHAHINEIIPYVGADYIQTFMKGRSDWSNIVPKSYPGASFYIGTRFHDYFSVELGYDCSKNQKKEWGLLGGSTFFNSSIETQPVLAGVTKLSRTAAHIDAVGFLPIADCFELLGSVGIGWVQPKIKIGDINVPVGSTLNSSALATVSGKGRGTLRVGAGGSYMLTDLVGLRAKVNWETTRTLVLKGNAFFQQLGYQEKGFKSTTAISVGAFVKF